MNSITRIERSEAALHISDDISFADFMDIGRQLANRDRNLKWEVGDWVRFGQERFGEQFALALDEITDDPRALAKAARVSERFPPEKRDPSLSYAHYTHLVDMPEAEAEKLIAQAASARLSAKELRIKAMNRKVETGQIMIWQGDDPAHEQLMAMARAWNRAGKDVRREFLDMASEADLGVIDA